MKTFYFGFALLLIASCKPNSEEQSSNPRPKATTTEETVYTDTTYEYEKRTGASGNYEYTYDVIGTDEQGNEVTGMVEMQGKYGVGTLQTTNETEMEIEAEWVGYGQIQATDERGNTYQLQVTQ